MTPRDPAQLVLKEHQTNCILGRQGGKHFVCVNPESLNVEGPHCGDASTSLSSGVQKKAAVGPTDLTSALQTQLTFDADTDNLSTTPSSSSLDTCSSPKIFDAFNKSTGSTVHQEAAAAAAGEAREAVEGSCSSFSEADVFSDEHPKIARSVTDGELRHRVLSPLSHHGVSTQEPLWKDATFHPGTQSSFWLG